MITHYIQLYRYNDALKVLTEKASEALQHGSEAVGRDGGRGRERKGGREGGGGKDCRKISCHTNFITELSTNDFST